VADVDKVTAETRALEWCQQHRDDLGLTESLQIGASKLPEADGSRHVIVLDNANLARRINLYVRPDGAVERLTDNG
jgi:hypothetical protein